MATNEEVLKGLPNDTVRLALIELIENKVPCKDYSLHLEKGSAKGDNYIGVVHRLSVTYKENDEPKKLGIFVKVPPDNLVRREQFFARPCFLREALLYDEYLPLVAEFQRSKGIIPEKDGFKEHARCYKTLTGYLEEAIIMEDLNLQGFIMFSRFKFPSLDVIKTVMRALGKLHALSFALKDQRPEEFAKFKDLEEIFARSNDLLMDYINSLKDIAYNSVSDEGDKEYLEHVKAFIGSKPLFKRLEEVVDGSRAEPYSVVCHGDSWSNNILFKLEDEVAVDARLIDWQLSRYASPVCDLVYYLFSCTDKATRDEHYEDILDTYYSELETFLRRFGSDPAVLFPRTALDEQMKKFGALALVMGLMVIPTIAVEGDKIPDLDELSARMEAGDNEYAKEAMQSNAPATRLRIRDVIIDLIRLGYI